MQKVLLFAEGSFCHGAVIFMHRFCLFYFSALMQ
jgi:hypothetical protein